MRQATAPRLLAPFRFFFLTGWPPRLGTCGAPLHGQTNCFSVGKPLQSGPYALSTTAPFLLPSHRCAWPPHAHPVPSLRHRLWTAILEQAGPGGHFYRRRGWSPLVFPFQPAPCPPALFCLGGDPLLDASSIFQACCQLNQGSCRQCLRRFPPRFWRLGRLAMARVSWGPARPSARARRMALLVAPSMSQTAPCTRTFICSSLFGILPTRSPRGATSLLSGYSSPPVLDLLLP